MGYGDALEEIVQTLRDAGIPATTEAASVQLPGALVVPGTITFDRLSTGEYGAVVEVYLLTSNKGAVQSLNDLTKLLAQFRGVFDVGQAEPITIQLQAAGPDPAPGLRIELNLDITQE